MKKIAALSYTGRFKVFFFLNFMANGILMPYLGLYFFQQGLTGGEVAILLAINPLVKTLMQPFWTLLSDLRHMHRKILQYSLLGLGAVSLLLIPAKSFFLWALVMVAFSVLEAPYIPLGAAIALGYLHSIGRASEFGSLRLWGSIGFVVASLLIGNLFLDRLIGALPVLFTLILLVTALLVQSLPETSYTQPVNWAESRRIFKNYPVFIFLLAGIVFVGFTSGVSNQYFAVYMDSIQASGSLIGLAIALMAVTEIPLMGYASTFIRRFGVKRVLLAGIAVVPLRFFLYAVIRNPWMILPVQLLQGAIMMSVLVVAAVYVSDLLPAELNATGQGLLSTAFSGAGMTLGLLTAGLIYESLGLRMIWMVCGWMGVLALAWVWFSFSPVVQRRSRV